MALTPEAARNLTFPCPLLPGRGSNPPPTAPPPPARAQQEVASAPRRGVPRGDNIDGPVQAGGRCKCPREGHQNLYKRNAALRPSPAACHAGSQEAGKTHINTRPQSRADARPTPCPGTERGRPGAPSPEAPIPAAHKTMVTVTLTTIPTAGKHHKEPTTGCLPRKALEMYGPFQFPQQVWEV